jgi:iron complex outermembrane recepter protein
MNLSKTPAVFGAVYFDFAEKFTLTAEARYQWDNINQASLFPIPVPLQTHTYTSFSPRVSLDYKFSDNSMAYALFSRGYRPGGFNTALIGNNPLVVAQLNAVGVQVAYAQETLNNWEAGIKATWLDNRLQTVVDVYYDKWTNGQVASSFFVNLPGGGFGAVGGTINNGRVNLSGVEAEARFAATEHLLLSGSVAYMYNIIKSFQDFSNGPKIYGSTDASGYALPGAPRWTFSLSPQYTDHLMGDWDWFARVDWTYRSRMFLDTHNIAWTAPLSLVNLRFGVTRDKLRVEFYANNLFDNRTVAVAGLASDLINQTFFTGIRIAAPSKRVLGMKGSYQF